MKPNPFIFLIGNNLVCALLLIALVVVVFDWLQGGQQNLLIVMLLFGFAILSFRANRQVTAYKNFQDQWDTISKGDAGGKQYQPRRKSQIAAAIFLWLISSYILLKIPRESDPQFYDLTLFIFIPLTLWLCYLLLRAFPGLAASLFRRGSNIANNQEHIQKDYIASHCQSVPKSAAAAAQINQQLPDYCKVLLERK